MTLGWAVVGTGKIAGTAVAPAIGKLDDGALVASVGSNLEKSSAFAAAHGGRAYASYHELLSDDRVDVVYIATPNALHADQVVAAAAAGKHVFCDKPLATSAVDAQRAVEACEAAGVQLGINFQTRHHAGMADAKAALAEGRIGAALIAECEVSPGRNPFHGWRTDPKLAGLGTINNLGVHGYDLLRYLLCAEVDEVTVLTDAGRRHELERIALALLRFANGALAYVNANQLVPNCRPDFTIYGSEGRISGRGVTRPFIEHGELSILNGESEETFAMQTTDAFDRSVAAFQRAVVTGETPNASGIDGLRSVELTEALARSAREGRTVPVEKH